MHQSLAAGLVLLIFILRLSKERYEANHIPRENPRLAILQPFLDETTTCLRERFHGMKAELVFDISKYACLIGKSKRRNHAS
jgi:hypothetical protein